MRRSGQAWLRGIWIVAAVTLVAVVASAVALRILRPVVSVTHVVEGPVVQAFYATGTLTPDREYPIRSNVAGIVVDVKVDKGQRVKRDDVLAVVKNDELPLKLEQAKAELNEKRQRADDKSSPVLAEYDAKVSAFKDLLELAVNEKQRQVNLLEKGNGSQSDMDHAMERVKAVWSDLESAKAQRAAKKLELEKEMAIAKAALDIAEWNFDQQTIRSPIDGVVLDRPASLGTRLAINDHLMQVADVEPGQLVVRAQVDEEDRTKLRDGQKVIVTLYSFPGRPFSGSVHKIYPQADADRRTFEVDVKLNDPESSMAPGMTGELAFEVASKPVAMVVPAQAVQAGVVWVVRDQKLVRSAAQVGLKSVERAEILSGLSSGDLVLISPIGQMHEGQQVRTESVDPRAAAALNKPVEKTDSFKGFN
jgi:HlyD family secretion protein